MIGGCVTGKTKMNESNFICCHRGRPYKLESARSFSVISIVRQERGADGGGGDGESVRDAYAHKCTRSGRDGDKDWLHAVCRSFCTCDSIWFPPQTDFNKCWQPSTLFSLEVNKSRDTKGHIQWRLNVNQSVYNPLYCCTGTSSKPPHEKEPFSGIMFVQFHR